MKSILILIVFIFYAKSALFSQDLLTKISGDELKVKVIEVNQAEIKYKKFDNPQGPLFTISRSDVFMIKYENGTKDIITELDKVRNETSKKDEMDQKGKDDSKANYRVHGAAIGGTVATTVLFSPLLGLVPAVLTTSSEPIDNNLNAPNSNLLKDTDYKNAYVKQAHKTKKDKIWRAYGISAAAWLVVLLIL